MRSCLHTFALRAQKWQWHLRGKYTGPSEQISLSLSGGLVFTLRSRTDITVGFRNIDKEFAVGKSSCKAASPTKRVSLVERQSGGGQWRALIDYYVANTAGQWHALL